MRERPPTRLDPPRLLALWFSRFSLQNRCGGPRRPSPRSRRRRPSPAVPTAAGPSFESVGEATEDDDSVLGDGAPKAAQLSRAISRVEGREGAHQSSVAAVKGFEQKASQIAEAIKAQERGDGAIDKMVMHPSAEWRRYWDGHFNFIVLVYIAYTVPYRLAFDLPAMGGWYWFEFIIDLYYWADFVMCFHTAYWEKIDDGDDVRYVTDLEEIRSHYLRTWFLPDLLAILPVEYVKRNAQNIAVCSWHLVKDPCGDHVVKGVDHHVMRAFTVIRLFRLLKLGHLPRVQHIIFSFLDEFILKYHLFFSMSKLLLSLMFISHWMACLYGSQYNFEREDHSGIESIHWEMYIGAVYWAVQTVTTVGYGNVVPTTISERVVACFVMLLGGFVFSTIISKVASVLEPNSGENIEVRRKLALRRFIEEKKIPRSLIVRINTYYKNEKDDSFGNNEVIAGLPDVIRTDVNYFVYGSVIIDAFSGTVMPNEMFVEFMCRRMYPKRYTRDTPLSMTNEFVENIFIVAEGRVAVAAREGDLLEDTGDVDTKAYNEKISDANYDNDDPGAGCLMPPGALINPGVALGYCRGVLCTRPYDKIVNLIVLSKQDLMDVVEEHHPLLARNVMDEFIEQLTWSRKSTQRLGLEGIGRIDLWDEENKRVKAKWDVILQQERRKEDEARLSRGGSLNSLKDDDDDAIVEAPRLVEAEIGGDKFELVQKQVQQQSIVLAQVANSFKESAEKTRDKLGEQNANLKKFQTSVIDALKSHSHRIERIEGAIEGLHRLLVAQMGGLPYHAETGEKLGFEPSSDPYLAKAKDDLRLGGRAYAGQPRPRGGPDDFGVEALNRDVADDDNARRLKYAAGASASGRPGSRSSPPPPLRGYESARLRRAL